LLFDGLLAISGAIGTPVTAGLAAPLGLSIPQEQSIYFIASIFMLFAGVVLLLFINKDLNNIDREAKWGSWKLLLSLFIPFVAISYFLQDISGVIASAILGIISYFVLFTNRKINWNPWLPYGVLILILLLPKIIPLLSDLISWEISFKDIFGSSVSASLKPLKSPLIPFAITSIFALTISNVRKLNLKPVFSSSTKVFMILFPSLAITQLMLNSGTSMPSMVETIAGLFARSGDFYPLASPFIGVLGTFITGSTTVSNIIFGSVQYNTASQLSLSTELILALQLGGASLGNAVCLFNIIAAAAVAQVTDYTAILKRNLLPVITAALIIAILGFLFTVFN
jgi:lactate permease